ncbi:MAG: ABC transporter substrate-binding protein [bacterium]|nr:ABC transporter substrate-binding protein [bacterium]
MKIFKSLLVLSIILALSVGVCSAEKTVVTFAMGQMNAIETDIMEKLFDEYMAENSDIEIKILAGPQNATDLLGLYLQFFEAKSTEVDVVQIDVIWPGDLANNLLDLFQFEGVKEVVEGHFPAIVENNTVDGKLMGIPYYTDAGMLYYRTDLLEKYGYDGPPATWDELEEMAKKIQDGERADNPDFWSFVWQGNAYEGLTCDALEWVKSSGGGSIVEPDGTISINNEAAVAALERAAAWIGEISPPGITGFGEEDARRLWQAGNSAFMRNWPYAYSLGNADDSAIKGKFDIAPLPGAEVGQSAATLGGWQIAVSKYSANPEAAAKVAMYIASEKVLKARAIGGTFLPTIMSLYKDPDVLNTHPFMGRLYDVFINAVARPSTITAPKYNQVSTKFFNAVYDVLTGKKDAQDAIDELELDLEDLLG